MADAELLARPDAFDHLHLVCESFNTLRRYTLAFLEVLELTAARPYNGSCLCTTATDSGGALDDLRSTAKGECCRLLKRLPANVAAVVLANKSPELFGSCWRVTASFAATTCPFRVADQRY